MKDYGNGQKSFNEDDLVLDFSTSGTLEDLIEDALQTEEGSRDHLRARWIEDTIATLRSVRRSVCLTQAELARKMETHQSSIARLEGEDDITLGKVWDYLYACGEAPAKIEHVSFAVMREFVRLQPEALETIGAVTRYCRADQSRATGLLATRLPWVSQALHDESGLNNISPRHTIWSTTGALGNSAVPVRGSSDPVVPTRNGNSKVA